jgi:hypothetical protein
MKIQLDAQQNESCICFHLFTSPFNSRNCAAADILQAVMAHNQAWADRRASADAWKLTHHLEGKCSRTGWGFRRSLRPPCGGHPACIRGLLPEIDTPDSCSPFLVRRAARIPEILEPAGGPHSLMSTLAGLMQLKWPGPSMYKLIRAASGLVRRHPRLFAPGQTLEGWRCSLRLQADMTSTRSREAGTSRFLR